MTKKTLFLPLFILIALFLMAGTFNSATAKTENLNLANFFPATHFMNTKLIKQWIEEVEKATDGAIKVTTFPGSTLLKAPETYDGIVSGTADIGVGVFAYNRGRFPVMEGFELPGINVGSCTAATLTAWDGYKKFMPKELADTKLFWLYSVGPGSLYTTKEVKGLGDIEGLRIRTTGLTATSVKALGGVPVAMGMPESYEALSKGVVDGIIGPPEILKGWKLADVTKYITKMPPVYNSIHYCVMNLDKWNALPEDVRKTVEAVNEKFVMTAGQIWDSEMKGNGIDYGLEQGLKMGELSDEDNAKAQALIQPIMDDYVKRVSEKGLPGKEILDFVQQKAAEYSQQYPPSY